MIVFGDREKPRPFENSIRPESLFQESPLPARQLQGLPLSAGNQAGFKSAKETTPERRTASQGLLMN